METEQLLPIVGGSTFGRYPTISGRKVYNYFVSDGWLVSFPGWKKIIDLTLGSEGRGSFRSMRGDIALVVDNNAVWKITPNIGKSFVGTIQSFQGPVFMDENLDGQICIVDQLNMYIYNRNTNALTIQTANTPDWLVPNYVCFHDTYFLIGNADSTGNGARWGAFSFLDDNNITLTYELAFQTKPDYARAIVRLSQKGGNVLVFGEAVIEIQTNVGGLLGYQRLLTINIDYGTISVATIASIDNFVAWLAINEKTEPLIMYFDGETAHKISTDGINYFLSTIKHPERSFAFFYRKDGHIFYQLTFYDAEDDVSLVYDFETQLFFFVTDANLKSHPARGVWYINNNTYFLNYKNGSVYQLSTDFSYYNENISENIDFNQINMIPRQIIGDTFRIGGKPNPFSVTGFYLTLEQGAEPFYSELAAETAESLSPNVFYKPGVDLSFSQDGAVTFSNEVRRDMNFSAQRQNIMQWNQLGWMNEITPKIKIWSYGRSVVNNAMIMIQN